MEGCQENYLNGFDLAVTTEKAYIPGMAARKILQPDKTFADFGFNPN